MSHHWLVLRISVRFQIRHLRPVPKPDVLPKGKGLILSIIHSCTPSCVDGVRKVVEPFHLQICLFLSMPHRRQSCVAHQRQFQGTDLILQFVSCLLVFTVLQLLIPFGHCKLLSVLNNCFTNSLLNIGFMVSLYP